MLFVSVGPVLGFILFIAFTVMVIRSFPEAWRQSRITARKRKKIKALKKQVYLDIKHMTPEERAQTNWSFYARDLAYNNIGTLDISDWYGFIMTTMTKHKWH